MEGGENFSVGQRQVGAAGFRIIEIIFMIVIVLAVVLFCIWTCMKYQNKTGVRLLSKSSK